MEVQTDFFLEFESIKVSFFFLSNLWIPSIMDNRTAKEITNRQTIYHQCEQYLLCQEINDILSENITFKCTTNNQQ